MLLDIAGIDGLTLSVIPHQLQADSSNAINQGSIAYPLFNPRKESNYD